MSELRIAMPHNIFSPEVSPARRRIFFALIGLIVVTGWIWIYYDLKAKDERGLVFASEIRAHMETGLVSARLSTDHSPEYRKLCFVAEDQTTLQFLADAFARADTQRSPARTKVLMEFTVEMEFADGQTIALTGDRYERTPRDLYLIPSLYVRDKHGRWQPVGPVYTPLRIPETAGWLQQQFVKHGCALM